MRLAAARALALVLALGAGSALAQDAKTPNVTLSNGVIRVSEDPINLNKSHVNSNGQWQITWVLADSATFRFTDDGIVIKGNQPDGLNCGQQANGARFTCKFRPKTGTFSYKYDINVQPRAGGARINLDPTINTNF